MKTFFSIVLIIIWGVVAKYASLYVLNIAGLPGALLAGMPGKRSRGRFIFGSTISTIGQSYIYLSFVAFIVNWTKLAGARDDVIGLLLWPFASLAAILPIWFTMLHAIWEARESKIDNPQVVALQITFLVTLLSFGVFIFAPRLIRLGWGWVPYVK